jgi:hypothetical protein
MSTVPIPRDSRLTRHDPLGSGVRRTDHRDGAGHLEPSYEATLRHRASRRACAKKERAFASTRADATAEEIAERTVLAMTSGGSGDESTLCPTATEENGDPLVDALTLTEFSDDGDLSRRTKTTMAGAFPRCERDATREDASAERPPDSVVRPGESGRSRESVVRSQLYIGGMCRETTAATLREWLAAHGVSVHGIRMAHGRGSGLGRGFAFVEFEETDAARRAVAALAGFSMEGRMPSFQVVGLRLPR